MTYQKNIKIYMAHAGMKQSDLAKASGMSENGLSSILTNKVDPKLSTLLKIANALNVPLWKLFINED